MRYKILVLFVLFVASVGCAAAAEEQRLQYTEDVMIHVGDRITLGDYVLTYEDSSSGRYFEIGRKEGDRLHILTQVRRDKLYDHKGRTFNETGENMSIRLNEIDYDSEGRFLNLTVVSRDDVFADARLDSSAPRIVIVSRGGSTTVPLTLENTGLVDQTFQLRAQNNVSLRASFEMQGFNVSELFLGAGETQRMDARIAVPETAPLGTHDVTFMAQNRSTATEHIRLSVRGTQKERRLRMDVEQTYTEVQPGQETSVRVTLRNGGGAPLNDISFDVTGPDGWQVEARPQEISRLERRDRRGTRIMVQAPADAQPGDYFVEVSASSEHASVEPSEVRVHIREESGLEVVGLVLMVFSLGILAAVYRKFGRR